MQQQPPSLRPYSTPPSYPPAQQTSGRAIASLVMGGVSFFILGLAPITGTIALILGLQARKECAPDGPYAGRGIATAGAVVGGATLGLSLLVYAVVIVAVVMLGNGASRHEQTQMYADFKLTRERAAEYASLNDGSLGPGGLPLTTKSYTYMGRT